MRRQDDVRTAEEGPREVWSRFVLEDVETGRGDLSVFERLVQGGQVDQSAAARVDEDEPGPNPRRDAPR